MMESFGIINGNINCIAAGETCLTFAGMVTWINYGQGYVVTKEFEENRMTSRKKQKQQKARDENTE